MQDAASAAMQRTMHRDASWKMSRDAASAAMLRIMHRDASRKMSRDALGMRARSAGTRYNISFSGFGGSRGIFILIFHQKLWLRFLNDASSLCFLMYFLKKGRNYGGLRYLE